MTVAVNVQCFATIDQPASFGAALGNEREEPGASRGMEPEQVNRPASITLVV